MSEFSVKGRNRSRVLAMQALYQWQMAQVDLHDIEAEFRVENDGLKVDWEFFATLFRELPKQLSTIDDEIKQRIDRKFDELNPVELAILRLGTFELMRCIEVPYLVVINEYVVMAKKYGATDGYGFVNAVLDKVARDHRQAELAVAKKVT